MQQRVDYDRIAHLYDEPLRDHPVDPNLLQFMSERPDLPSSDLRCLDIGCGTGKQLAANRLHLADPLVVGLDRFHAMLKEAQTRSPACGWVQGDGARTPLCDGSFDYITSQFSYHHMLDRQGMIAETFRILKRGGRFVMTNLDPWLMPGWIVYNIFPAAWERDQQDFLPVDEFAGMLKDLGFSNVQIRRQHRPEDITLGSFLAYAAQRFRTSQLMAIGDDAYRDGIATLRKEIEKRGEEAHVDSEICLVVVTGDKGP
jgi:SAM-dependent methyltransferase